ncbi:uncharacterized protein LOC109433075 isoform X2 [Aedes albopictus]|uniref:Secreted protein n=1 Tax=Aedes albopictus TaxID=7160 RepID=A0ABM1Y297_AEDAL|nr:uncharacterized protein LOC109433075 [Aedes albopictus]
MSAKTWQRSSQQSALLMAKWLFGSKSKPIESDNNNNNSKPTTPSGSVIESSSCSASVMEDMSDKVESACELNDQNTLKPEPNEMVECWYSGDELAEDDVEEEQVFTGRLRGHRYRKLKAPKRKKLGHVEIILKARNTII